MKRIGPGLLLAAACVHVTPFTPRALAGESFPLRPGWSMALALDGTVAGRPAIIRLAVEEPFSRVTDGCFESPPPVLARVRTPSAVQSLSPDAGPDSGGGTAEEVLVPAVQLGSRMLGDVRALRGPGEGCELTVGSEILIGFVLEVDPAARTVAFHSAMPPPPKFVTEQSVVLELVRDPRTDRPSLAVQLDSVGTPLTLPMVLATAAERVEVSAAAGRALGTPLGSHPVPFAPTGLAFAPGWVLHHVVVSVLPEEGPVSTASVEPATPPTPSGVLGADGWGHFRALVDLRGQQLVLFRRPPPVAEGDGPQSWTHLSSQSTPGGTLLRFASWQPLDKGGQVALEPVHARVQSCRIGLTLGPADPGYSLEVAIPWAQLEQALPSCAKELAGVPAWTGELAITAAPRPCSGFCLYAQELPKGRTLCACSGRLAAVSPAAQVRPLPSAVAPDNAEPTDPAESPKAR